MNFLPISQWFSHFLSVIGQQCQIDLPLHFLSAVYLLSIFTVSAFSWIIFQDHSWHYDPDSVELVFCPFFQFRQRKGSRTHSRAFLYISNVLQSPAAAVKCSPWTWWCIENSRPPPPPPTSAVAEFFQELRHWIFFPTSGKICLFVLGWRRDVRIGIVSQGADEKFAILRLPFTCLRVQLYYDEWWAA